jgi:recombination associated protein RdgC
MWFKNLQLYRLPAPWNIDLARLEELWRVAPSSSARATSRSAAAGFAAQGRRAGLSQLNRQWLLALSVEQRLLPSSVVNEEVRERAEAIEQQQGYAPGRKQLKELKRTRHRGTDAARLHPSPQHLRLDRSAKWLVLRRRQQPGKAEEVIEHLRHCLDEFPLTLLHTQLSPQSAMADWLAGGDAPAGFTIDRDCELKSVPATKRRPSATSATRLTKSAARSRRTWRPASCRPAWR